MSGTERKNQMNPHANELNSAEPDSRASASSAPSTKPITAETTVSHSVSQIPRNTASLKKYSANTGQRHCGLLKNVHTSCARKNTATTLSAQRVQCFSGTTLRAGTVFWAGTTLRAGTVSRGAGSGRGSASVRGAASVFVFAGDAGACVGAGAGSALGPGSSASTCRGCTSRSPISFSKGCTPTSAGESDTSNSGVYPWPR